MIVPVHDPRQIATKWDRQSPRGNQYGQRKKPHGMQPSISELSAALEPFWSNERREQVDKQEQRDCCRQINHVLNPSSDLLACADEGVAEDQGHESQREHCWQPHCEIY